MANGEITVNVTGLDKYKEVEKYAEEAGAACEEMKYDIEMVIMMIKNRMELIVPDNKGKGVIVGLGLAKDIIEEHLTKYLDLDD